MTDLKPDERRKLAEAAGAIKFLCKNAAADILRIGGHLLAAKTVLGTKRFPDWCRDTFAWGMADVARMIAVARAFAGVPKDALDGFDPTALYALSAPSAPPAARHAAIEAVRDGRRVSAAAARELIAAARGTVRPADEPRTPRPERAVRDDDTLERLAYPALVALTAGGAGVLVRQLDDAEEDDPTARPWRCQVFRPDGTTAPPVVSKDSLASAITLAAGTQPDRECKGCGAVAPVFDGFSRKAGYPLGRSFFCRRCEVRRVGDKKKLARGTATQEELDATPVRRHPADAGPKGSPATPPAARREPPAG